MLDDAFDALKQYDWGTDRAPVAPIEAAVTAAYGKADARLDLEKRLLAALQSDVSRDAKDFVCRMLTIVGRPASVPALAGLLKDPNAAVARAAATALGDIATVEAAKALQEYRPSSAETQQIMIDAQLACAEALLADNQNVVALAIYKSLAGDNQA